jgi:hypothetical protein
MKAGCNRFPNQWHSKPAARLVASPKTDGRCEQGAVSHQETQPNQPPPKSLTESVELFPEMFPSGLPFFQ